MHYGGGGLLCQLGREFPWCDDVCARAPAQHPRPDVVQLRDLHPESQPAGDMGIKQLPKRSGEYLFEIIMRRYETKSTMMTSTRSPPQRCARSCGG